MQRLWVVEMQLIDESEEYGCFGDNEEPDEDESWE